MRQYIFQPSEARISSVIVAAVVVCLLVSPQSGFAAEDCPGRFGRLRSFFARVKPIDQATPAKIERAPGLFRAFTEANQAPAWLKYSLEFQNMTSKNIRANESIYRAAIQANHPHIQFLRDIGFRLNVLESGHLEIEVPALEQALKRYETIMRAHVASGRIHADDVLIPMRAMTNADGKLIFLRFGEKIPDGAVARSSLLEDQEYQEIAKARGFVLGEPVMGTLRSGMHSAIEHDLVHLGVFAREPEVQTAIAKFNAVASANVMNSEMIAERSFYINESMEGVGSENRPKIVELFRKYGVLTRTMRRNQPVDLKEVRKVVNKMSNASIEAMIEEVRRRRHDLIRKIGGAVSDVVDRQWLLNSFDQSGLPSLRSRTSLKGPDAILDLLEIGQTFPKQYDEARRKDVARLIAALDNTSYFNFPDVVTALTEENISAQSPVFTYLCLNFEILRLSCR